RSRLPRPSATASTTVLSTDGSRARSYPSRRRGSRIRSAPAVLGELGPHGVGVGGRERPVRLLGDGPPPPRIVGLPRLTAQWRLVHLVARRQRYRGRQAHE